MMKLNKYILFLLFFPLLYNASCKRIDESKVKHTNEKITIFPDYTGICIPPNIAPLNFKINKKASSFFVRLSGSDYIINIYSGKQNIQIPIKKWKKLLSKNKGKNIAIDIYCKEDNGKYTEYPSITNSVSEYEIDSYLAYRLIGPVYNYWNKLGLYQRDLENFDESPIITNNTTKDGCMNCHNFCMKNPNRFLFHTRGGAAGTVLVLARDGELKAVNTTSEFNKAAGAYPSWHPSGKLIAFSYNKLSLLINSTGTESREVMDYNSNLIIYRIDSNFIETDPAIASDKCNETFPNWSPKGDYLYFCSTPKLDSTLGPNKIKKEHYYQKVRYNLMRVEYNEKTERFGQLDTVVNAAEMSKSLTIPRISPNNKYIMVCLSDWGNFPIYNKTSDLYLYNIESMILKKLNPTCKCHFVNH